MRHRTVVAVIALAAAAAPLASQAPAVDTGTIAPNFTARGATKDGLLAAPISLDMYRGKTVVLAFFAQARTKG